MPPEPVAAAQFTVIWAALVHWFGGTLLERMAGAVGGAVILKGPRRAVPELLPALSTARTWNHQSVPSVSTQVMRAVSTAASGTVVEEWLHSYE